LSATDKKKLYDLASIHGVELKIADTRATLSGITAAVKQCTIGILEHITKTNTHSVPYPPEWEPQTANCEKKKVTINSAEWKEIEVN
jgi:hypothetical protein